MKNNKQQALDKFKQLLTEAHELKKKPAFSPEFSKWHRDTEVAIKYYFKDDQKHIDDFTGISYSCSVSWTGKPDTTHQDFMNGLQNAIPVIESFISEIDEYWTDNQDQQFNENPVANIKLILSRFHVIARQIRSRYSNRTTLEVEDEYDVQDLLHVLLKLYFDDIRPEEWTPSYAGGSSRMDFLLKSEKVVIEVKKTRKSLNTKQIGDELLIDIQRYKAHPDCKKLICFTYDPEGRISNPIGLSKDLSKTIDNLEVLVTINP